MVYQCQPSGIRRATTILLRSRSSPCPTTQRGPTVTSRMRSLQGQQRIVKKDNGLKDKHSIIENVVHFRPGYFLDVHIIPFYEALDFSSVFLGWGLSWSGPGRGWRTRKLTPLSLSFLTKLVSLTKMADFFYGAVDCLIIENCLCFSFSLFTIVLVYLRVKYDGPLKKNVLDLIQYV